MLKFLLILGLAVYIFYKISSFFFRAGAASQQNRSYPPPPHDSNSNRQNGQKKSNFKGGEYIDYEEVK